MNDFNLPHGFFPIILFRMYIKYDMDISLIGIIKRGKVSTWQGSELVSNTKNKGKRKDRI